MLASIRFDNNVAPADILQIYSIFGISRKTFQNILIVACKRIQKTNFTLAYGPGHLFYNASIFLHNLTEVQICSFIFCFIIFSLNCSVFAQIHGCKT